MKTVTKTLDLLFVAATTAFILAGAVMLLIQCFCLATMNGGLSIAVYEFIVPKAGIVASVSALSAVFFGYFNNKAREEREGEGV
jgi:hypothetical protein